ncbi:MAG: circularly permuted type 2 ATP-grasp protein [Candidatus Omnitrophica bacterium]|nr:circularly permuted type 2 ATP-grasp protein [Candidatus Omnitrophota bacterium]
MTELAKETFFSGYDPQGFYDEYFRADQQVRSAASQFIERVNTLSKSEILNRQRTAEQFFYNTGITFNTGGSSNGIDRIFPFDLFPRIISHEEWGMIERGLQQRITALNEFLRDVYGAQKILKDKVIPSELVYSGRHFLKSCMGLMPQQGIWAHVSGTDLVRDKDGTLYVLEDNLRCPSGVSYVLANRSVVKRAFPNFFRNYAIETVENYPEQLFDTLQHIAPQSRRDATIVVLTPGIFNSAYFEHSYLAQRMGVELVEGQDLIVQDGYVFMKTTQGLQRVDVIYRRIDDVFLDPLVFRPDSQLGVPGLMEVYRQGRVALANAPGTGIADDKVIYKFVPEMIRYYLSEDPMIANVPTYLCCDEKDRDYVLKNMEKLVIKPANEAGGYGMLIGPYSSSAERKRFAQLICKEPRNYLAQPTLSLSRVPTIIRNRCEGRHVDLRPFILNGRNVYVMPGGLSRVAMKKGSLVVNSSQGGGSKDTWVMRKQVGSC